MNCSYCCCGLVAVAVVELIPGTGGTVAAGVLPGGVLGCFAASALCAGDCECNGQKSGVIDVGCFTARARCAGDCECEMGKDMGE